MTEPQTIHENDYNIIHSNATGVQAVGYNVANIPAEFSALHIKALYEQASLSFITPNPILGTQASFKLYLDTVYTTTRFTNFTTTTASVDIYDLLCKNNVVTAGNGPLDLWNSDLGLMKGVGAAPSTAYNQQLGVVPTTSFLFNKYHRIVKRTKVELGPGQSHEHVFVHNAKRSYDLDGNNLSSALTTLDIKGLTHYTMLVCNGIVVETGVGTGVCTTSDIKIGMVTNRRTRVRLLTTSPRLATYNDRMVHNAVLTEQYVNFGDGLVKTGVAEA